MISLTLFCLFCISTAIAVSTSQPQQPSVPVANNTEVNATELLDKDGLFEGDLKLTNEFILEHYNFSSIPGGEELREKLIGEVNSSHKIERRGVGRVGHIRLWPNQIVRYGISSSISQSTANLIRQVIGLWEQNTCLRFVTANSGDYIEFINSYSECYSTHIGRQGGRQVINLESPGCETVGIIAHEIAHALGFWHEQSRPDRDSYVNILLNNVRIGEAHNFMKKNNDEINSFGSTYDYGSIMHYKTTAFDIPGCVGANCTTIEVKNQAEYIAQGRPKLGQRVALSASDIAQANRLYSCPANLRVDIRYAINLPNTDPWLNDPDPYVRVQARQGSNSLVTRSTRYIGGTINATWNEWLEFGCQGWVDFGIQIWDSDDFLTGGDDPMSNKQIIIPNIGKHQQKHQAHGNGYLIYDYHLIPDLNDCLPNPCQNGGICTDLCTSYRCSCTPGWFGTNCDIGARNLRVYVRNANHLPDTDPWLNYPDPYVRVEAKQASNSLVTRSTRYIGGTTNPTWNEWLEFGCHGWVDFGIQIWDSDDFLTGGDDPMSNKQIIIPNFGQHQQQIHYAHGIGYLIYDYHLDVNDCSPNPCQNGGTCTDLCTSYRCSCRPGYFGTNCDIGTRNLRVFVRYARNLPDTDPWLNYPDPYVRVEAKQASNSHVTHSTRYIGGTTNPTWNQWLEFGCHGWVDFGIQVWDSDDFLTGADDAMSNKQIITPNIGSRHSQRHQAHGNGYLIYDYHLIRDVNDCSPNPCRNGGTCTDLCTSYRCSCRSGWFGTNCDIRGGNLRVYAGHARGLPDADGWWNNSDPYMEFIATDANGNTRRLTSSARGGTQNPNWNQHLNFGQGTWRSLRVRVYDSDDDADDPLSNSVTYYFPGPTVSRTNVNHRCHSGYARFDYHYTV